MKAMDKMNLTFGRGKVKIALQGTERKWKMQQERLSQNFTTRWDEILEIHCIK
jgi:DNA polymerase V